MQGQAGVFRTFAPVYSEFGIKRYMDETKRLFDVLESRLSKAKWLAGDKYTLADIASYSWAQAAPLTIGLQLDGWPSLKKWIETIAERPAVKKAIDIPNKQDLAQRAKMFQDMRDKMDARKETNKPEL